MGWRGREHVQGGRLGRQSGLVNPVVLIGRVRVSQEIRGQHTPQRPTDTCPFSGGRKRGSKA